MYGIGMYSITHSSNQDFSLRQYNICYCGLLIQSESKQRLIIALENFLKFGDCTQAGPLFLTF